MKQRQREALIAALANELRAEGSWCGETHLQKATYVLQEMLDVPLGFQHILYKYGPFDYELRDELAIMRADGFIEMQQVQGYGPRLGVTNGANRQLLDRWPKTIKRYRARMQFVAKRFRNRGVGELERLATALWVRRERPTATLEEQARRLNSIKPHVGIDLALEALTEVADWETGARALVSRSSRRRRRTK